MAGILTGLESALSTAGKDVTSAVGGLATTLGNEVANVSTIAGVAEQAAKNDVSGAVSGLEAVGHTISTIPSTVYSEISGAVGSAGKTIDNTIIGIETGFGDLFKGLETGIATPEGEINNTIIGIETGFGDLFKGLETGIATAEGEIDNTIIGIETGFGDLFKGLETGIANAGSVVGQGFTGALNAVSGGLSTLASDASGVISDLAGGVGSAVEGVGSAIESGAGALNTDLLVAAGLAAAVVIALIATSGGRKGKGKK